MKRVLIAGCGDVGTQLGLELASDGVEVWGLRRRPDGLPPELHPFAADLSDPTSLESLPPGLDAVVYAAAAGATDEGAYRRTYVDGPRHLLEALRAQGQLLERIVFASSTAVYAQEHGEVVDETSETVPRDFRGALMLDGEHVIACSSFPATIVRFGGIYGPGRTFLVDAIRAGRLGVSPDGRSPHTNRIHRDDAARCLAHVLRLANPAPVYVAVDTEPTPMDDVVRYVASLLGVTPAVARSSTGRGGDKLCSSALLQASGFRFRFPTYRAGYADVVGRRPT